MRLVRARWIGAALAAALLACGAEPVRPRLVLVIATCTVNTRFLGAYDPGVTTTPFLDELARESLVFERHYTEAGQSGVSFASLFSGRQADAHGIFHHPKRARDELLWMPEVFAAAGYETYAWLAHPNASGALNYAQGVAPERQFERVPHGRGGEFPRVLEALEKDPARRAMVLTDFTATHWPYGGGHSLTTFCHSYEEICGDWRADTRFQEDMRALHADPRGFSFDTERAMAEARLGPEDLERLSESAEILYRAGVYRLDRIVRSLVSAVERHGLLDESLIVFTADHGEALHTEAAFPWAHGFQLSPEVLHVPLIVRGPAVGVSAGRYAAVTRSIDVLPTLAGLASLETRGPGVPGVDLSPAIRGEAPPPPLTAWSHTSLWADPVWRQYSGYERFRARFPVRDPALMWVSAIVEDRFYRLHRDAEGAWHPERFDLATDPMALRSLREPVDEADQAVFSELRRYRERMVRAARREADASSGEGIPEEEILRALGYVE